MKVYAFIGAGPANLHRALLIRETEPYATFVFFDPRFETDGIGEFTYERSRDMIFRLEARVDRDITRLLRSTDARDYYRVSSTTPESFNPATNQSDDQDILGDSDFIQIQIRDLQRALLLELQNRGSSHFIQQVIADNDDDSVIQFIEAHQAELGVSIETLDDVEIHRGSGALRDSEEMNTIIYPTKLSYSPDEDISDDLRAFLSVPEHGLVTFHYRDISTSSWLTGNGLIQSQLLANRRSLDNTAWQRLSEEPFGWSLARPPRVRLFATNRILYVAAETPARWSSLGESEYNERLVNYAQLITSLVLPNFTLLRGFQPFEPKSVSRFQTHRGERGEVYKEEPLHFSNGHRYTRKTHFLGDGVYLPQYQTGSGFVSSYDRNKLFDEIRQLRTLNQVLLAALRLNLLDLSHLRLEDLHAVDLFKALEVSFNNGEPLNKILLRRHPVVRRLVKQYAKQLGLPDEGRYTEKQMKQIVEAMKVELLMAGSHDIIQQNKEKVSTYFLALERQAVSGLLGVLSFPTTLRNYNNDAPVGGEVREAVPSNSASRLLYLMMMIAKGSHRYLKEVIPQLINVDLSEATDEDLERFRLLLMYNLIKNHERHFTPILENISAARIARAGLARLIGETPRLEESFTQFILRHHVIFFKMIQSLPAAQFAQVVRQVTGHLRIEASPLQTDILSRLISSLSRESEPSSARSEPSFGLRLPLTGHSSSHQFSAAPLLGSTALESSNATNATIRQLEELLPLTLRRSINRRNTGAQDFASRSRLFVSTENTPVDVQVRTPETTGRATPAHADLVQRAATHPLYNRFFAAYGAPETTAPTVTTPAEEAPRGQTEPDDDIDSIIDERFGIDRTP